MKYVAPLLLLLSFTDPVGRLVWVERDQVSTVQPAIVCAPGAETQIMMVTGPLCVRESLAEVVSILEKKHDIAGRFRGVYGD